MRRGGGWRGKRAETRSDELALHIIYVYSSILTLIPPHSPHRDLGMLCEEENCDERMRRYPMLDLTKLKAVLEKYQGIGLAEKMKGGGGILKLDKKDVQNIIKKIANQI